MLFNLEVLSNGRKKIIQYDNINTEFKDLETGETYFREARVKDYKRITETYDIDFSDIGILYINLGLKCNFACKYCHQNSFREATQVTSCTPTKARKLLEILRNRKDLNPRAIAFWGGEPLVYWKSIQVLLSGLRELYPEAKINFPTNGSLLTKEIADFLKKYNATFYISYDGKTSNRDEAILDNPKVVDCLRSIEEGISIMPTQNRASIPIKAIHDEFRDLNIHLNTISIYSIARCNPYNRNQAEEIRIPKVKRDAYSEFLYSVLHTSDKRNLNLYGGFFDRFNHELEMFYKGYRIDSEATSFCPHVLGRDVCIDCDGKIFNCMNIPIHVMGTLNDFKPVDTSHLFKNHLKKKSCLECPYVLACRGGCPLIQSDESPEFKVNCDNLKMIAVPFFRTVIERLLGVYLKKITRISDGKVFGEW